MSGTLVIVLIVVVWLFVLAPWLLRGQKPIHKAGEAFDETRVVYEGGSEPIQARRRPRLNRSDVHAFSAEDHSVGVAEDVEPVLVEDSASQRIVNSVKEKFSRKVIDGEVVSELEVPAQQPLGQDELGQEAPAGESPVELDEDGEYSYDDSYASPDDFLYPDEEEAVAEDVEKQEVEEDAEPESRRVLATPRDLSEDLSEEELEFASRRKGRGGWDPEAYQQAMDERYARRTRTLIGLGVSVVATLVLAAFLGGGWWALPVVAAVLTGLYLFALRRQVIAEQELRARRISQLRRARLGVRNKNDEELGIPHHLRRPGAVVLELDDESPDFAHLATVDAASYLNPDVERRAS